MAVASANSPGTPLPPAAKPRRRWYQFTLRTAGVWMVLLCLLLGSFAWWRDRAERQRKVVEELRALGAKVEYRYYSFSHRESNAAHGISKEYFLSYWLRCCVGDDFLYEVNNVSLASSYDSSAIPPETTRAAISSLKKCRRLKRLHLEANAMRGGDLEQFPFLESLEVLSLFSEKTGTHPFLKDGDLAVLERATCLRSLYLYRLPIGDAAMQHLRGLQQLRTLSLCDTHITDAGLKHLRNLNSLTDLNLSQDAITGEGFADFGPKPELVRLDLSETKFTDAALRHLSQFPNLEQLYLDDTQINGRGIAELAGLAGIDGIRLDGCPVTDDGIANIEIPQGWKSFSLARTKITDKGVFRLRLPPSVTKLWLNDCVVTDSSLDSLLRFTNLEHVFVDKTQITPAGIQRFEALHPACEVIK